MYCVVTSSINTEVEFYILLQSSSVLWTTWSCLCQRPDVKHGLHENILWE